MISSASESLEMAAAATELLPVRFVDRICFDVAVTDCCGLRTASRRPDSLARLLSDFLSALITPFACLGETTDTCRSRRTLGDVRRGRRVRSRLSCPTKLPSCCHAAVASPDAA